MGWLQGEVALITGGGSGLGWALVERFLEEGAQVAVLQRSQDKVDALNEHFGGRVLAIAGDVANYEDNVRAVDATLERLEMTAEGEISNWPVDFFGDDLGEIAARTLAGLPDEPMQPTTQDNGQK